MEHYGKSSHYRQVYRGLSSWFLPSWQKPAESSSDTQSFCHLAPLHALESGSFSALNTQSRPPNKYLLMVFLFSFPLALYSI